MTHTPYLSEFRGQWQLIAPIIIRDSLLDAINYYILLRLAHCSLQIAVL